MHYKKLFSWVLVGLAVGLLGAFGLLQLGIPWTSSTAAQIGPETLDGQVVYLVGDKPPQRAFASVERIQSTLGATLATDWHQVTQKFENQPIEALVIEKNAQELVDREWLVNAYARGIAIAGINFTPEEFSNLIGSSCLNLSDLTRYEEDSYIIVSYHIRGDNPSDVDLVARQFAATCGEWNEQNIPEPQGSVHLNVHESTDTLTNEEQLNTFALSLALHANPPQTAP